MSNESVKIKADVMWAYLEKMNEMTQRYQVDLCNLSDNAVKALESLGVEVKTKEGKGKFITCKSKRTISAHDDGGTPIDGSILGNGSKAAALVSYYQWNFGGKSGIAPSLQKLVITDLVPYTGGVTAFETDDLL
jgi:hypothetical protein